MYICDARCVPVNHTPSKTNMCFNLTDLKTESLFLKPRTKRKKPNQKQKSHGQHDLLFFSQLVGVNIHSSTDIYIYIYIYKKT